MARAFHRRTTCRLQPPSTASTRPQRRRSSPKAELPRRAGGERHRDYGRGAVVGVADGAEGQHVKGEQLEQDADPEARLHVARDASPPPAPATSGREIIAWGTLTRSRATSVPHSQQEQHRHGERDRVMPDCLGAPPATWWAGPAR